MHLRNSISFREPKASHRLMYLIILVLGIFNFFWGEKIPSGGGLGFDGVIYGNMVQNLGHLVTAGGLSGYYTQRILPAAIVRGMLIVSGQSTSVVHIIQSFEIYNLVLLCVICWAWIRLVKYCKITLLGSWLGFAGLFINFECSKQEFYYPVITDVTALLIAILLLLFYVERKPFHLFIVTVIGSFAWPIVSACGALLILFVHSKYSEQVVAPTASLKKSKMIRYVRISYLSILILSVLGYLSLVSLGSTYGMTRISVSALAILTRLHLGNHSVSSVMLLLERAITAIPSLFLLFLSLATLVSSSRLFQETWAALCSTRVSIRGLAMGAYFIPFCLTKLIANPHIANESSLVNLASFSMFPAEGKFLLPLVTLAVFWGPVFLMLILVWGDLARQARSIGPGMLAVLGISLPLGLVGEPRFLTTAWPFLVLGFVLVMESMPIYKSFKYAFFVLSVLYAQFWMKLNLAPWKQPDYDGLLEFPKQVYLMHYGLWMSWWAYLVQLSALALSIVWLRRTMFAKNADRLDDQDAVLFVKK